MLLAVAVFTGRDDVLDAMSPALGKRSDVVYRCRIVSCEGFQAVRARVVMCIEDIIPLTGCDPLAVCHGFATIISDNLFDYPASL